MDPQLTSNSGGLVGVRERFSYGSNGDLFQLDHPDTCRFLIWTYIRQTDSSIIREGAVANNRAQRQPGSLAADPWEQATSEFRVLSISTIRSSSFIIRARHVLWDAVLPEEIPRLVYEQSDIGALSSHLTARKTITDYDALHICIDVAEALSVFHENGIAHNDLHGDNVLLFPNQGHDRRRQFTAKLANFGCVSFADDSRRRLGQSRWSDAPELFSSNNMTSSDLYSFGLLCWAVCVRWSNPFLSSYFASAFGKQSSSETHWIRATIQSGDQDLRSLTSEMLEEVTNLKSDPSDKLGKLIGESLKLVGHHGRYTEFEQAISHLCLFDPDARSLSKAKVAFGSREPPNTIDKDPPMTNLSLLVLHTDDTPGAKPILQGECFEFPIRNETAHGTANLLRLYTAISLLRSQAAGSSSFIPTSWFGRVCDFLQHLVKAAAQQNSLGTGIIAREASLALFDIHIARLGASMNTSLRQTATEQLMIIALLENNWNLQPTVRNLYEQFRELLQPGGQVVSETLSQLLAYLEAREQVDERYLEIPHNQPSTSVAVAELNRRYLHRTEDSTPRVTNPLRELLQGLVRFQDSQPTREGTSHIPSRLNELFESLNRFRDIQHMGGRTFHFLYVLNQLVQGFYTLRARPTSEIVLNLIRILSRLLEGLHNTGQRTPSRSSRLTEFVEGFRGSNFLSPELTSEIADGLSDVAEGYETLRGIGSSMSHILQLESPPSPRPDIESAPKNNYIQIVNRAPMVLQALSSRQRGLVIHLLKEDPISLKRETANHFARVALERSVRYQVAYKDIYEALSSETKASVDPWELLVLALDASPEDRIAWHGSENVKQLKYLFEFIFQHFFDALSSKGTPPGKVYGRALRSRNRDILPVLDEWKDLLGTVDRVGCLEIFGNHEPKFLVENWWHLSDAMRQTCVRSDEINSKLFSNLLSSDQESVRARKRGLRWLLAHGFRPNLDTLAAALKRHDRRSAAVLVAYLDIDFSFAARIVDEAITDGPCLLRDFIALVRYSKPVREGHALPVERLMTPSEAFEATSPCLCLLDYFLLITTSSPLSDAGSRNHQCIARTLFDLFKNVHPTVDNAWPLGQVLFHGNARMIELALDYLPDEILREIVDMWWFDPTMLRAILEFVDLEKRHSMSPIHSPGKLFSPGHLGASIEFLRKITGKDDLVATSPRLFRAIKSHAKERLGWVEKRHQHDALWEKIVHSISRLDEASQAGDENVTLEELGASRGVQSLLAAHESSIPALKAFISTFQQKETLSAAAFPEPRSAAFGRKWEKNQLQYLGREAMLVAALGLLLSFPDCLSRTQKSAKPLLKLLGVSRTALETARTKWCALTDRLSLQSDGDMTNDDWGREVSRMDKFVQLVSIAINEFVAPEIVPKTNGRGNSTHESPLAHRRPHSPHQRPLRQEQEHGLQNRKSSGLESSPNPKESKSPLQNRKPATQHRRPLGPNRGLLFPSLMLSTKWLFNQTSESLQQASMQNPIAPFLTNPFNLFQPNPTLPSHYDSDANELRLVFISFVILASKMINMDGNVEAQECFSRLMPNTHQFFAMPSFEHAGLVEFLGKLLQSNDPFPGLDDIYSNLPPMQRYSMRCDATFALRLLGRVVSGAAGEALGNYHWKSVVKRLSDNIVSLGWMMTDGDVANFESWCSSQEELVLLLNELERRDLANYKTLAALLGVFSFVVSADHEEIKALAKILTDSFFEESNGCRDIPYQSSGKRQHVGGIIQQVLNERFEGASAWWIARVCQLALRELGDDEPLPRQRSHLRGRTRPPDVFIEWPKHALEDIYVLGRGISLPNQSAAVRNSDLRIELLMRKGRWVLACSRLEDLISTVNQQVDRGDANVTGMAIWHVEMMLGWCQARSGMVSEAQNTFGRIIAKQKKLRSIEFRADVLLAVLSRDITASTSSPHRWDFLSTGELSRYMTRILPSHYFGNWLTTRITNHPRGLATCGGRNLPTELRPAWTAARNLLDGGYILWHFRHDHGISDLSEKARGKRRETVAFRSGFPRWGVFNVLRYHLHFLEARVLDTTFSDSPPALLAQMTETLSWILTSIQHYCDAKTFSITSVTDTGSGGGCGPSCTELEISDWGSFSPMLIPQQLLVRHMLVETAVALAKLPVVSPNMLLDVEAVEEMLLMADPFMHFSSRSAPLHRLRGSMDFGKRLFASAAINFSRAEQALAEDVKADGRIVDKHPLLKEARGMRLLCEFLAKEGDPTGDSSSAASLLEQSDGNTTEELPKFDENLLFCITGNYQVLSHHAEVMFRNGQRAKALKLLTDLLKSRPRLGRDQFPAIKRSLSEGDLRCARTASPFASTRGHRTTQDDIGGLVANTGVWRKRDWATEVEPAIFARPEESDYWSFANTSDQTHNQNVDDDAHDAQQQSEPPPANHTENNESWFTFGQRARDFASRNLPWTSFWSGAKSTDQGSVREVEEHLNDPENWFTFGNETDDDHPGGDCWYVFGRHLRWVPFGDDEDEDIQRARDELEQSMPGDPNHVRSYFKLGLYLLIPSMKSNTMPDIDEAIRCLQKAADSTPEKSDRRALVLAYLYQAIGKRDSVISRKSRTYDRSDLSRAIDIGRELISIIPDRFSNDRFEFSWRLANLLGQRYQDKHSRGDLDEAIDLLEELLATSVDTAPRSRILAHLGPLLFHRFQRFAVDDDLNQALKLTCEAIELAPEQDPGLPELWGDFEVILDSIPPETAGLSKGSDAREDVIRFLRNEIRSLSDQGFDQNYRNAFAHAKTLYRYSEEEGMRSMKQALIAAANGGDRNFIISSWLSLVYEHRARFGWNPALQLQLEGLVHVQDPNYERAYLALYDLCGSGEWIRANKREGESLATVPMSDLEQHEGYQMLLGLIFFHIWNTDYDESYREKAVASCWRAMKLLKKPGNNHASGVMAFGEMLIKLEMMANNSEGAYEAAEAMIGFIPRLAVSSHVLESRHKGGGFKSYTPSRPSLGPLAAELAVRAGKTAATAIRFLEQARGLLSTSFEELRSDLRELQSFHPELADRFTQLRELLDQPSVPGATRLRGEMQARYHTGTEFDDLIAEIRSRDGFENFLSAPSETQMKLAAANGPIVVINVGIISCYALIIEKTRIRPLYLARIRPPHLKRLVEMGITRPAVLRRLWDVMMKPILISLGFTGPPLDGESYPHVWWIPTGILSKFPLHAAGHHAPGSTETVMDWVMSSYSSSVKAIVNGRRRALGHLARSRSDAPLHTILVAMDSTPGLSGSGALPFAVEEVNSVKGLCESMSMKVTNIQSLKRKKSELLSLLPGCAIFHFAGHGKTNDKDPSESCLLLNDWEEDPLTVGSLFEQNLCEKAPFLAYLSACSTGEIQGTDDRQEVLMDDSIHLISACQIAGFRHVIGTLWTVNDRSCLDVARFTYEELARAESGLADEAVCRGLHRAVKRVRDRWLETYESDEGDYVDWDKEMAALISPDHRKRVMETISKIPQLVKHFGAELAERRSFFEDDRAQYSSPASCHQDSASSIEQDVGDYKVPDDNNEGNLCSDDDSDSDDGGVSILGPRGQRNARDIALCENEPLYWVPYVHFGV